jgi:hypothetical protein
MLEPEERVVVGRPDYSLPLAELWKQIILSFIDHLKGFNHIFTMSLLEDCQGIEPFITPTWIPNLEIENSLRHISLMPFRSWACSNFAGNIRFLDDNVLRILGVPLETVKGITYVDSFEDVDAAIRSFLLTYNVLSSPIPTGWSSMEELAAMAFTGMWMQDKEVNPRKNKPTIKESVAAIKRILSNQKAPLLAFATSKDWFGIFSKAVLSGRSLFITHGSYIGVGPRTMKDGDMVVVLTGCTYPMLLRPNRNIASRSRTFLTIKVADPQFYIIGACNIPGFMESEAFLGPTPKMFPHFWHRLPEGWFAQCYQNQETGEIRWDDPRLENWLIDHAEYRRMSNDHRTMPIQLDPTVFQSMGVDVEFFDIL